MCQDWLLYQMHLRCDCFFKPEFCIIINIHLNNEVDRNTHINSWTAKGEADDLISCQMISVVYSYYYFLYFNVNVIIINL